MNKTFKILLVVVVVASAAAVAAYFGYNWMKDNKLPDITEDVELYVRPETDASAIVGMILEKDCVVWPDRLAGVFEKHDVASFAKPGHYVIPAGSTAVYVTRMLNNGWQTPVKMTIAGTLRKRGEIARKIANQMMVDSASVRAAFEDKELLAEFGFTPENVFALFVPDTYEMYWDASVHDIFAKQYEAYKAFWTPENQEKAKTAGLSQMEVSILASIVSGETNYVPEMPKIAGVYLNRLKIGMKLQADPTVNFAFDYKYDRILNEMLSVDSPYNTYKYAGLPPAPIYIPTRNTLNAVLNADRADGYIYFCAFAPGKPNHRFAKTYSEHLKNAREYSKAYKEWKAAKGK